MISLLISRYIIELVLGLILLFFINLAIFKWKCNILADIITEKLRTELEDMIEDNPHINTYTGDRQNTVDQNFMDEDPRR